MQLPEQISLSSVSPGKNYYDRKEWFDGNQTNVYEDVRKYDHKYVHFFFIGIRGKNLLDQSETSLSDQRSKPCAQLGQYLRY